MENWIEISFRDSIVSRDGRPFGAGQGNRMRSAGWPLPSVVAGSLRSAVGKAAGREFSAQTGQDLLGLEVAGGLPFSESDRTVYYPAPQDCVMRPEPQAIFAVRPQEISTGGGCDLPHAALRPVMLPERIAGEDFKPGQVPAWWPEETFASWMLGETVEFGKSFLAMPTVDARTHVYIDPQTGATEEGKLFSTTALALGLLPRCGTSDRKGFRERYCPVRMALRVGGEGWALETAEKIDSLHPLGGERKLACWKTSGKKLWSCPDRLVAPSGGSQARANGTCNTSHIFARVEAGMAGRRFDGQAARHGCCFTPGGGEHSEVAGGFRLVAGGTARPQGHSADGPGGRGLFF